VRDEARERGLISKQEIEEVLALLDDPTIAVSSMRMCNVWGRRPSN
jgi:hypothetical protein